MVIGYRMGKCDNSVTKTGHMVELYIRFLSFIFGEVTMLKYLLGRTLDVSNIMFALMVKCAAHGEAVLKREH